MAMIAVNIQQLTDQYIEWQWTIKPALKMAANYHPSKQFHNGFCLYMLSEVCLGDHATQPAIVFQFLKSCICLPYSQSSETLFPLQS